MARKTVLVLRTCNADLTSWGGFQWPESGAVEAPDFKPTFECGNGLHGLLWGEGNAQYLSSDSAAKWLVVKVVEKDVLHGDGDLIDKCKFSKGNVVFCGTRDEAIAYLNAHGGFGRAIVYGTATAGDYGTATAGYRGTATAGDYGTATAGYRGTATAGKGGTATAGVYGTATAGEGGLINLSWWDGKRYRIAIGYIGEDGIGPNIKYRVANNGKIEAAE